MIRRLTLALVGLVAGALALSAIGTFALARVDARERTRTHCEELSIALASLVQQATQTQNLGPVARALRLENASIVRVQPGGRIVQTLPAGVELADLQRPELRRGQVVSGSHGSLVWAAKATRVRQIATIVVVTRHLEVVPAEAARWFVIAAIGTITVAVVVGVGLARGLTRRLREAEDVAQRISAGDLSARTVHTEGTDEVAVLARAVNEMASTLEQARDLQRHFLLNVSHDLRTPLTSIRGYAEAITDGTATDTARAATVIVGESKRLERLVADLLELAKLDARQLSLRPMRTDVAEVVREIVDAVRPAATEAAVQLDVAADVPTFADVDPDRIGQAVANLLENALTHTASTVRVGVTSDDAAVAPIVISVVDDGAGIAPDDLDRIFDPLYVGRRTPRRPAVGSGLGLAIVRELVTAMGGEVTAGNEPTGGARLEIRLRPVDA